MHSRRHRWSRLGLGSAAVLASAALALSGCASDSGDGSSAAGSADTGKPVRGGTLTVGISSDPGGLDQNAQSSVEAVQISQLIIEKLFALDAHNKPQPMLVKSYKVSDDKLTYDFTLRKVTFSDGKDLTADDAIASLDYWERVNTIGKKVKEDTASMKKTGERSFEIVLKKPRYPFLQELTGTGTGIKEAKTVKGVGQKGFAPDKAVGTGPYKLKEYKTNDEIVLVRNDDYSSRSEKPSLGSGAKHAYLDELDFKIVPDADALANGLKTGQWQYTMDIAPDHYQEFKNDTQFVTHTLKGGGINLLTLNTYKYSIFHKQKARDALNLALNKKAFNAAYDPKIAPQTGSLTVKDNKNLYSTAGDKQYNAYNPKKAKKMFAEAGLKKGDTIKVLTSGSFPRLKQWSTLIQGQLKKIGIKVDIEAYDFVTMLAKWQQHPDSWDIVPIFMDCSFPDPLQYPYLQSTHSDKSATHPELPDTRPAALVKELDDYLAATDEKQAHDIMQKITKTYWEHKGGINLSLSKPFAVYSPQLKGYPNARYFFANAWLAKK